ncbi:MAG: hypothetical protein WBQ16_00425 [Nitrososphaeraceae archaeon]
MLRACRKVIISDNSDEGHFTPSRRATDTSFRFKTRRTVKKLPYEKYLLVEGLCKAYDNFAADCNCKTTEFGYRGFLFHLCEFVNLTAEQIVKKYKKKGYSYAFEDVCREWILKIKKEVADKKVKGQKVSLAVWAVKKFCMNNGIRIDWDIIAKLIPHFKNNADDEAYTRDQIKLMLEYADIRVRVAILIFSSSAIRREAMTQLRHGDIEPKYDPITGNLIAAKIIAYNDDDARYPTFITPEAYNTYLKYIEKRARYGEKITNETPVIIKRFDVNNGEAEIDNDPVSPSTLDGYIAVVARDAGVREKSELYTNRYKVKLIHGLRKYIETTLLDLTDDKEEPLLDRGTCLELLGNHMELRQRYHTQENYDRRTKEKKELRLLNAYRKAVSELTITDEERERLKREEAERKLKTMESVELELQKVKLQRNQESTLLAEVTSRLAKMEQLVGARLVNTTQISGDISPDVKNVDDWFDKIRRGEIKPEFTEPKEELRPIPNIDGLTNEEESLAEEYANLEVELGEVKNTKRIKEIQSRMKEIECAIQTLEV